MCSHIYIMSYGHEPFLDGHSSSPHNSDGPWRLAVCKCQDSSPPSPPSTLATLYALWFEGEGHISPTLQSKQVDLVNIHSTCYTIVNGNGWKKSFNSIKILIHSTISYLCWTWGDISEKSFFIWKASRREYPLHLKFWFVFLSFSFQPMSSSQ